MVQVYNTKTGQILNIPEDQVRSMSSQWKVGTPPTSSTTQSPATSPTTQPPANLNTTPLGAGGVNNLFKLYYGRDATREELNYWQNKSDAELRPKLIPNSKRELSRNQPTGSTGETTPTQDAGAEEERIRQEKLQALYDEIQNDPNMSAEDKMLVGTIIKSDEYTSGRTVPDKAEIAKIITKASEQAESEMKPYYEKVSGETLQDLKTKMGDIRNEAARFQQQEALSYKQTLDQTKQSLRARGMTFSGQNRAMLGKEGALGAEGVEGTLPTQRRYNWEDKSASLQERSRDLGQQGERLLGSGQVGIYEGLVDPYAQGIDYQAGGTRMQYSPKKIGQEGYYRIYGQEATGDLSDSYLSGLAEQRKQAKLQRKEKIISNRYY